MGVPSKLKNYEEKLVKSDRHTLFLKNWKTDFPEEGGVYALWEKNIPVYVGETSGLKSRMGDISRPVNHPFPAKVATLLDIDKSDIVQLRNSIALSYKISYIVVPFGRAEVEEYLILRWRNTLINKPTKRLLNGSQYDWIKPA